MAFHVNDFETVHAADAATAKPIWNAQLDGVFKDSQSVAGPRSTPMVDGDYVYVQSCQGEFQCLQANSGKLIWRINFVKDFDAVFQGERGSASGASRHGYTGSPIIDGNRIFVGVGGTNGASVVCFDKRTGQMIWKSQNDIPGHSGPVIVQIGGEKQVMCFTAEGVVGMAALDGRLLWRVPIQTRLGWHAVTPVVFEDMVVAASYQAGLIGIRVTHEGNQWKAERAWLQKSLGINFSSPVAVGPYLYGLAPGRKLICVDMRTGEPMWTKTDVFSGSIEKDYAAFVVMKDRILILAYNGQLLLIAADPKEFRLIGCVNICGDTWCNPAYSDGRLFLRDEKELKCLSLLP